MSFVWSFDISCRHFRPRKWICCKQEKSKTIAWSESHGCTAWRIPTVQLASALRNQHMGFFLVAATSCWKLKSSLKSVPLVRELKSHIIYLLDLSWCRTDCNRFLKSTLYLFKGKNGAPLGKFHSSYVWYYSAIPFCACPNLLCPWSFGCCRAKLSILSQSVNNITACWVLKW